MPSRRATCGWRWPRWPARTQDSRTWAELLQHRFGGSGALAGHPVGNLVLTGLAETLGDPVAALDAAARLVHAVGRVLPMSTEPLEIAADVVGLDEADPDRMQRIRGQVAVATTCGRVVSVRLVPAAPAACPEAVAAVREADLVVLGPGSWFTSVLPHLLVPGLLAALEQTPAYRVVALNLAAQPGETAGFSPQQHLEVLAAHAPALRVDAVVADPDAVPDARGLMSGVSALGAPAGARAGGCRRRHRAARPGAAGGRVPGGAAGAPEPRGTGKRGYRGWR